VRQKAFILISAVLLFTAVLQGQCPLGNLWARLVYLRESKNLSPDMKLKTLLSILDSLSHCNNKDDSTYSFLLARIGKTYYDQGDFITAVRYYHQSIDVLIRNAGKPSVNLTHLPARYYYLALCFAALNSVGEKMEAFDSCLTVSTRLDYVDRSSLVAVQTWVEYFFDVGDYQRCIDYAQIWRTLSIKYANRNIGAEHTAGESSNKSALGWEVKAQLQLRKFERVENLLKDKLGEFRKEGRKDYLGMIYSQLALVNEQKGNYDNAIINYRQSLKYYESIRDNFNCKQTEKDLGNLYFKHLSDDLMALTHYRKALAYLNNDRADSAKDASETLDVFSDIANVYVRRGRYDLAFHCFQLAFNQLKPGTNEMAVLQSTPEDIRRISKIHYLTGLIIDKGDAYRKQYETTKEMQALREAIRVYKAADQFLDKVRGEQMEVESKLFWRSDTRRLYEHAIEACYLQNNPSDAFYFFERSRAVLLNDQLNEQHWLGERDILKQTQLKKRIQQLENNINKADKSSNQFSDLQNELFTSKQELQKLQDVIKANNPLYYQSFVEKNFITLDDVKRRLLKDHQALVEIFAGDSAIYSLVVTADKNYLEKISKPLYDSLSRVYSGFISNAEGLNKNFTGFVQVAHQLYRLLFNTVDLPPGRVIISPDGQSFPFEALITDVKTRNYFLYDHPVSYTYSARYLLNEFNQNNSSSSNNFFGIAPVQYSNGLPALTGSDQSLHRMENYFSHARTLVFGKASKDNFLNQFSDYRIIQLYTHATDSGYNGQPLIYFADTTLSLSDLFYSKKPATKLIVLSACETALGELHPGEGVFSFNRGFAALGIPSAVSNLWEVDNQATYKLTELFYKYVADGIPLDIALQKAKKEFITTSVSGENKLPYYWAASILVGQSKPIALQKSFPWKWVAVAGILLIVGIVGWQVRRKIPSTQFGIKRKLFRE